MPSWSLIPRLPSNHSLIANLIGAVKLPAIYPFPEFVDAGGLMSYSYDLMELVKIIANDIDAILRGANPGDIPYYQSSKFVLSINLKTARAQGLTVQATLTIGHPAQGRPRTQVRSATSAQPTAVRKMRM
jgi:putative ABC transport system substrate-binding protein